MIYTNGCSFTYGDELDDLTKSWPYLLAEHFNTSVVNDAVCSGTNYLTLYKTIKNLKNNYNYYIIAWTITARYTFYDSITNADVNFNSQVRQSLYDHDPLIIDWGEFLFKHFHNELYAFKLWLQQIIQLQTLFKIQNKKYLMVNTFKNNLNLWLSPKKDFIKNIKHLINFDRMNDEQIFDEYEEIQYYIKLIDTNNFYNWGNFTITELAKNYKLAPRGHMLEEGHKQLAKLLYNHICSK